MEFYRIFEKLNVVHLALLNLNFPEKMKYNDEL